MAVAWKATTGSVSASTGTLTLPWPAGHAVGDIALAFVESQANASSITTANGFAQAGSTVSATGTRLDVFWCRATSTTMGNLVLAANSDHQFGVIITYSGCISTGTPFLTPATSTKNTASTTTLAPSVTTTVANQLIVNAITKDLDATAAFVSAITNGNLTSINERFDAGTISGNGGGIAVSDGMMASPGATGTTSFTVTSSASAMMTVALLPPDPTFTQDAFRFYEDGTESGSTATAAQSTNVTRDVNGDSNIALRVRLQETAGSTALTTDDYQLQYSLNSGTYTNVGTGNSATTVGRLTTGATSELLASSGADNYVVRKFVFATSVSISTISGAVNKSAGSTALVRAIIIPDPLDASPIGEVAFSSAFRVPANTSLTFEDFTPTATATLSAGTYWIGFEGSYQGSGSASIAYDTGGATNEAAKPTSDVNPAPTYNSNNYSIKVTYTIPSIKAYDSASLTDAAATTNRLTGGTGSFVAGEVSEDGLVDDQLITGSNFTELLYSMTLVSSALSNGDTLDFRILRNGATTGMTYTSTPRITASKTGGGGGSPTFQGLMLMGVGS